MVVIMLPQTPPTFPFGRRAHRSAISSPLSSSPLRAPSLSPPHTMQQQPWHPLSPCDPNLLNILPRQSQQQQQHHQFTQRTTAHSSPSLPTPSPSTIFGSSPSLCGGGGNHHTMSNNNDQSTPGSSSSSGNSKFRFASRDARPNPVLKRREDAQAGRRRLFLQNVSQRREDRRWEMRGGEDELLKLEWYRLNRERQHVKDAEAAAYLGLGDDQVEILEDEEEQDAPRDIGFEPEDVDADALMADAIAREEQAEMDALVSSLDVDDEWQSQSRRSSAHFSDDEDYDGLFMELIQQQQDGQGTCQSQDVEMT